jgi:serine/threonine protein kinase
MTKQIASKIFWWIKAFTGEKEMLSKFNNPFIVQSAYTFETEEKHYFLMEYLSGGRLYHHLKLDGKFTEGKAKFYLA